MTYDDADHGNGEEALTTDQALRILADETRRSLLLELLEGAPNDSVRLTPPERAGEVLGDAAGDDDTTAEREETAHERLVTSLRHNHLPRLADADIVRWDRERGTVERGPGFADIEPFLCRLDEVSDELPADWHGGSDGGE